MSSLKDRSSSDGNFAVKILEKLFAYEDLSDPNVNLTGKRPNGSTAETQVLDPERISEIKEMVLKFVPGG